MAESLETTWGEVQAEDTVLDATGKQWRVFSAARDGDKAYVGITDEERYVTMTKDADEKVLTVPAAVAGITDGAVATETAAQTQARQTSDTYPSATTFTPLELRSHLYLVHGDKTATKVATQDEMLNRHWELHGDQPNHEHEAGA